MDRHELSCTAAPGCADAELLLLVYLRFERRPDVFRLAVHAVSRGCCASEPCAAGDAVWSGDDPQRSEPAMARPLTGSHGHLTLWPCSWIRCNGRLRADGGVPERV